MPLHDKLRLSAPQIPKYHPIISRSARCSQIEALLDNGARKDEILPNHSNHPAIDKPTYHESEWRIF